MGAVRKFPRKKMAPLRDPCSPASKHHFELVQRNPVKEKVEGDYLILLRCLHCANSVYVQTKKYTAKLKKPPTKKEMASWRRLDKRQSVA